MWRWLIGGVALLALGFLLAPAPIKQMVFSLAGGRNVVAPESRRGTPTDPQGDFVAAVLGATEDVWTEAAANGQLAALDATPDTSAASYRPPTLILYSAEVASGCGTFTSARGPLYCETDSRIYIDTAFFQLFNEGFGAPGDFAQAYIIAHEVGHHIQNELGILARSRALGGADQSVRVELQADCLAGVWAGVLDQRRNTSGAWIVEAGDLQEAIVGAGAVGDDAAGYTKVEAFTYGSAAQRQRWFLAGFHSRDPAQCDTFSIAAP